MNSVYWPIIKVAISWVVLSGCIVYNMPMVDSNNSVTEIMVHLAVVLATVVSYIHISDMALYGAQIAVNELVDEVDASSYMEYEDTTDPDFYRRLTNLLGKKDV